MSAAWGDKTLSVRGFPTLVVVCSLAVIAAQFYNGRQMTESLMEIRRAVETTNVAMAAAIRDDIRTATQEHKDMSWQIKLSSCVHTLDEDTKKAVRHSPNTPWSVWCWWVDEPPSQVREVVRP